MTTEEIEKRLALQKMFKDRLAKLDLNNYVDIVSDMVNKNSSIACQDLKKSKEVIVRDFKTKISRLEKECFSPIIEENENNLEYSGSKYFGSVWLSNKEIWPTNENGQYLTFVLQLDIKTLPKSYAKKLGGEGVLQFFFDYAGMNYPSENLIRIIVPGKNGCYHEQPKNKNDNYLIEGNLPKQKIITNWKSEIDFPHTEESIEDNELLEQICDDPEFENLTAYQGDKLGGYAFWTQAGDSSDSLIFQLDAGCMYEGRSFDAHAPNLFASDGTGHIFFNTEDNSFYFDWACG